MKLLSLALAACMLFALAGSVSAQHSSLPALDIPNGVGVNIHFTDPKPGEIKMLAEGGFGWVRMDFVWGATEKVKGQYDFSAYDRLMTALDRHRIKALFILDYGNALYDSGLSPHSDEGRTAMARWAAAAAKHFKGRGILWEMWNEPNISFWKPKPNVDDYVKLALAVGETIRAAAPGEAYIGPATSTVDFAFLEACFKGGLLEYWDALSIHPYRQNDPETASAEFRRLRGLIAQYAPKGKRIPILSGEWGYSSVWSGMNEIKQGKRLPRQWLNNLANDVPLSIWYDWHDEGLDPKEAEHHFGTVLNPYHKDRDPVYDPKPAYLAAKTLTTALNGFRFNKRLAVDSADDYVLLFSKGDEVRLAVWTTSLQPHNAVIPASPGRFRVTAHTGENLPLVTADKNGLTITVTDAPQYLVPEAPNDLLRVAAAWERLPLEITTKAPASPTVSVALSNPLSRSVEVNLGTGPADKKMRVAAGKTAQMMVAPPVTWAADPVPFLVSLNISGLGRIAQETQIIVTNPLRVTLLPRHYNVFPVRVENPSGEAFGGTAMLHPGPSVLRPRLLKLPVVFKTGEMEKVLKFNFPEEFEASYQAGLTLGDEKNHLVLDMPAAIFRTVDDFARYTGGPLDTYKIVADGDAKVASEQTLSGAASPEGLPVLGTGSLKITYRFEPGWKFIRVVPQNDTAKKIEGQPKALGLWIYGDGEGNLARLRFVDATGQTFQPSGPAITWKGWRYVTFPFDSASSGHWGGAADGVIHYPIAWDSLFLLDNPTRAKTQGELYITAPTLIY